MSVTKPTGAEVRAQRVIEEFDAFCPSDVRLRARVLEVSQRPPTDRWGSADPQRKECRRVANRGVVALGPHPAAPDLRAQGSAPGARVFSELAELSVTYHVSQAAADGARMQMNRLPPVHVLGHARRSARRRSSLAPGQTIVDGTLGAGGHTEALADARGARRSGAGRSTATRRPWTPPSDAGRAAGEAGGRRLLRTARSAGAASDLRRSTASCSTWDCRAINWPTRARIQLRRRRASSTCGSTRPRASRPGG